jgi:hypothetical protein
MSKDRKHGNREVRKPKMVKSAAASAPPATIKGILEPATATKKKG